MMVKFEVMFKSGEKIFFESSDESHLFEGLMMKICYKLIPAEVAKFLP